MALRVAFLGTPDFAVPTLRALHAAGHDLARVYTQPPRPAGRGLPERASAVQQAADVLGLPVCAPDTLRDPETQRSFTTLGADVAVVVAYGRLLPAAFLRAPRFGCLNLHASLLPRWRGAAPIQHAILAGDGRHGFTVIRLDEGLDTGPILRQREVAVDPRPTAALLHDVLAAAGAPAVVTVLDDLAHGRGTAQPQPERGATLARKVTARDGRLDWARPADELDRRVRAMTPRPGAWFSHRGVRIRVPSATPIAVEGAPGTVLDDRFTVACGAGALRILTAQRPGGRPVDGAAFLRGFDLRAGSRLAEAA